MSSERPLMHLVFAADNGFARQLLVSSASAVYAMRGGCETPVVHVLDCGLLGTTWADYEATIRRLAEKVGLHVEVVRHFIDMRRFVDFACWTNGSRAIWARLLIPELLADVDQCLYSDCDVFFIGNPSETLASLDAGAILAGHRNPFGDLSPDARYFRAKNLPFSAETYLCSGFLAMNVKAFREEDLVARCFDFARQHLDAVALDQNVLNAVAYGRTAILPDGWGLFTHECYAFEGPIKAIHFSGGWPWVRPKNGFDAMCVSLSREACAIWHDFESRVLGLPPSAAAKPTRFQSLYGKILLWVSRLMNHLSLPIPRHRTLQELVAAYDQKGFTKSDRLELITKMKGSA